MIYEIVGIPGGGKSYLAAELIYNAINSGRHVVTDMPLSDFLLEHDLIHVWNSDLITSLDYQQLSDNEIEQRFNSDLDALYPKGSLYVFDECWKYLRGGSRIDLLPKQQLFFFKKHRHRVNENGLSDDVILATQDLSDISATVRSMIEQTILCIKPASIGLKGYSVRYFMSSGVKGVKPVDKLVIKTEQVKLKPEIFKLYDSHTNSINKTDSVNEGSAVKSTFYQSFKFKASIFLLVSCLVLGVFFVVHLSKSKDKYIGSSKPVNTVSQPVYVSPNVQHDFNNSLSIQQKQQSVKSVTKVEPIESSRWRILATVSNAFSQYVYVDDLSHKSRRVNVKNCIIDEFQQYICTLDNQVITLWSGSSVGTNLSDGINGTKNQLSK